MSQPSPSSAHSPLSRAHHFLVESGRPVERHLFAALYLGGARDPVLAALGAYQNPDGGFGHGLEPRLRGPESQPLATQYALRTLALVGGLRSRPAFAALDFLVSITRFSGGVPIVLPSEFGIPRDAEQALPDASVGAIGPTARIAALLLEHEVWHPWLESAVEFCWAAAERAADTPADDGLDTLDFDGIEPLLRFLEHTREREPADRRLADLAKLVLEWDLVCFELDARSGPLDWAPTPKRFAATLFTVEQLDRHLDALAARQHPDGGWPPEPGVPGHAAELESRSMRTLDAIGTLAAYGRL